MKMCFFIAPSFVFALAGCGQKAETPSVVLTVPAVSTSVTAPAAPPSNQSTSPTPSNSVVSVGDFPQAFELVDGRSLKGYQGLDPFKFLTMYSSKLDVKKGEFETTAEFQKRKSNTEALLAPISSKNLYAFKLGNFSVKYDADLKSYVSSYSCSVPYGETFMLCHLKIGDTQDAKYMAQNGYGAEVQVSQTSAIFMNLAIKVKNPLFKSNRNQLSNPDIDLKLPVSVDSVQAMKGHTLTMLVVGNVGGSGVSRAGSVYKAPTREDPRELSYTTLSIPFTVKKAIFYNETTGEILVEKSY